MAPTYASHSLEKENNGTCDFCLKEEGSEDDAIDSHDIPYVKHKHLTCEPALREQSRVRVV